MRDTHRTGGVLLGWVLLLSAHGVWAQDWPQWRGPNRDNKVVGFAAPVTWPNELTQHWRVPVGLGTASPALVGDKLYVFTRQGGDEVTSCLDAATGKILWQDKYAAQAVTGAAIGMGGLGPGPRSSPAVAEGKICTFGVGGVLSCLEAATGQVVWRKDSKAWPQFFTRSSPIILEGKCIAYLGGRDKPGEITAYDLATGAETWKWIGEGPSYGSFAILVVDATKQLVTPTVKSLVGISATDGKLLWQIPFAPRYNNGTPIIDGSTVIFSGQGVGTVALKIEKQGDRFAAKELWKKSQSAHQYNTPVLKEGLLFGLSPAGRGASNFFCMNAQTGDVLWTDKTPRGEGGAVLDAGSVLLALTTDSKLVAFKPNNQAYAELAKYKVADDPTWASPIIAGNRVFVKDRATLTLWTIP